MLTKGILIEQYVKGLHFHVKCCNLLSFSLAKVWRFSKTKNEYAVIYDLFYPCLQTGHSCPSPGATIAIWFNFFEGCNAGSRPFRMFNHEVKLSCSCNNDNELKQVQIL